MGFVPPGIIFCHTLGNITAKVEFCCIQMSNSHLPAHISTGDICNGLKPWVKYFEYFEVWKLKPKEGFEVDYHGLSWMNHGLSWMIMDYQLTSTSDSLLESRVFWMTILTALVWICSGAIGPFVGNECWQLIDEKVARKVENEGMKPYMVMMGMHSHSLIPYWLRASQLIDDKMRCPVTIHWPFVVLQRSWCFFKASNLLQSFMVLYWIELENYSTWTLTHLRHVSTWRLNQHIWKICSSNNDHLPRVQVEHKNMFVWFQPIWKTC